MVVITHGAAITARVKHKQMLQLAQNTVTGCMAYSDMKHHARDIGRVGMELPPNNFASVDCYTMKDLIHVTGQKMLMDVKNIVS